MQTEPVYVANLAKILHENGKGWIYINLYRGGMGVAAILEAVKVINSHATLSGGPWRF
jgi:hypothetical protein